MDDVVDLSISRDSVSLSNATVRDLRALTQNAGLTITPAPPSVNNGTFLSSSFPIQTGINGVIVFFSSFCLFERLKFSNSRTIQ